MKLTEEDKLDLLSEHLFTAIEEFSNKDVMLFVDLGAPLEFVREKKINSSYTKITALNYAATVGSNTFIMKYLLENGANPNVVDSYYKASPLLVAIGSNNFSAVEALVELGADVNFGNTNGFTALHKAACSNNLAFMKYLVDHGADIKANDNAGNTVMHYLSKSGDVSSFKYLIDLGVDYNQSNNEGVSVLMDALESENLVISNKLIASMSDINNQDVKGQSALHYAAEKDLETQVTKLIAKGADVNAKDKKGETPIFSAIHNYDHSKKKDKKQGIASILLSSGANVNIQNESGDNVLMKAIKSKMPAAWIKRIADKTTDFSVKNDKGQTALDVAISFTWAGDDLISYIENKTLEQSIGKEREAHQGMDF